MSRATPAGRSGHPSGGPLIAGAVLAGLCLGAAAGCGSLAARGRNAEGVRLFDQTRYQESIAQFQQAIEENPGDSDAYYNLAAGYHRMGTLNQDQALLAQAEQYYNQCLDRDENHRECYRGLAVLLVEQDRSEEAFRLLEGWVDRAPASAEPKLELARLFEEFGDPQAAKAHLREALAVDHENSQAFAALGRLREQMGERAEALKDYQRSLWHDRFQPEVAARVGALQSALNPITPITTPPGGTRLVTRNTNSLR